MKFSFTEDQLAIKDLAEKIMADRVTDEFWRGFSQSGEPYDKELWSVLGQSGLLGVALPEKIGGSGLGVIEMCILIQEQGRFLAPIPLVYSLAAGALSIAQFGNELQQKAYLSGLIEGTTLLTAPIGEMGKRSEEIAFDVKRSGNHWVLSGFSDSVPYAEQANAMIIPARYEKDIALFIVDSDMPGISVIPQISTNGEPVARLGLDNLLISDEALLTTGEKSWRLIEQQVTIAIAALQLGVAQEALRRTAEYTNERKQFGQTISGFQSVAHRAANSYIDIEAMRSTLWQAAWRLSEGIPAEKEVSIAKWWANEGAHRAVHSAQHLHGGIGSDIDYPLHRYFLWAKYLEFIGGGARRQLVDLGRLLVD